MKKLLTKVFSCNSINKKILIHIVFKAKSAEDKSNLDSVNQSLGANLNECKQLIEKQNEKISDSEKKISNLEESVSKADSINSEMTEKIVILIYRILFTNFQNNKIILKLNFF